MKFVMGADVGEFFRVKLHANYSHIRSVDAAKIGTEWDNNWLL